MDGELRLTEQLDMTRLYDKYAIVDPVVVLPLLVFQGAVLEFNIPYALGSGLYAINGTVVVCARGENSRVISSGTKEGCDVPSNYFPKSWNSGTEEISAIWDSSGGEFWKVSITNRYSDYPYNNQNTSSRNITTIKKVEIA